MMAYGTLLFWLMQLAAYLFALGFLAFVLGVIIYAVAVFKLGPRGQKPAARGRSGDPRG